MNRRNFVSLSGTALGSLLFTDSIYAAIKKDRLVQLPGKVFVTLDDGVHQLTPSANQTYVYKEVWVKLHYVNAMLKIEAGSPKEPLSNVILNWKYNEPNQAKILGDHWERSYGDLNFQPADFNRKMPWYFVQHNLKNTICFGVKTGCNTICHWQLGDGQMQLTLDTRSAGKGVNLGARVLNAADVIGTQAIAGENTFATTRRFCKMMCDKPLLPKQPVYGINDWYVAYGANSAELILNHTSRMAELVTDHSNKPFSVIDAGWATYAPALPNDGGWNDDFTRPNDKFKDMHQVANNIKKLGMRPGLWTRPLCASYKDAKNRLLPDISGRNSTKRPVLDPTIAENLEWIKNTIKVQREWGYELVKHDFSTYDILGKWGNHMEDDITTPGWAFNDNTKTTAEVILNLYRTIREGAQDIYLLGCNTASHLSAGLFEINRIGDDTSGKEWARTRKMGVNTLGFRMTQHNNFYAADGDCVGLTKAVPWEKNKQWMRLLAESSSAFFISAQEEATGAEQKEYIKRSFAMAAKKQPIAEPLDWLEQQWPAKWKLNGKIVDFNWGE
jgi:alpha-galactosidase